MTKTREKAIPEIKVKLVKELAEKMINSRTILIASCSGLPGSQFHEIKKNLRAKAEIKVVKKSVFIRAIDQTKKGSLQNLKKEVVPNFAIFFSDIDAFELSGLLSDSQSKTRAKPGQIAPEDIVIEPGPTDLIPGPAISELSGVGLKVSVKDGKLEIIKGATIVKSGEEIKQNVASVMGKLGIMPVKVGFEPIAAYDSKDDEVYSGIKINKKETLDDLRNLIKKARGFAVKVFYPTKETISYFIAKASVEEKSLVKLIGRDSDKSFQIEEKTKETIIEGTKDKKETKTVETQTENSKNDIKEDTKEEQ